MNTYTRTQREQARINAQHFVLYHWLFFTECRAWSRQDWNTRLKAEGLLARGTNWRDMTSVNRLLADLEALP
jgi:hypothetical protein